jgi:glycosyltransferase involved in cell wall biosynthesis
VVYNGVDPSLFKPSNKINKEDMILFTGRLTHGKGLPDLLRVAELLLKTHAKTRITIAGNGPLKNKLERSLKKRKLSNIKIIPHISHNKLVDIYQRARIFVLPTYYEGLSTSTIEAMSCQLPVVSTYIKSMPELVEHAVSGYLVDTGDIKGLYKHIVELLGDEKKQMEFGKNGRKKVLSKFLWPHVTDLITSQYKKLLGT